MDYSIQNQQPFGSQYYPPSIKKHEQHQPHHFHAPRESFEASTVHRLFPSPARLTSVPFMSAPGSYPSSRSSGSYETAQTHIHRTGEAFSSRGTVSPGEARSGPIGNGANAMAKRIVGKASVSSACGPCKKSHLACDIQRPCKRCVNMDKEDLCEDVPHKKRGRPKFNKKSMGTPYQRARPPHDEPLTYRQSLPPSYPNASPGNYDSTYHPTQEYRLSYQTGPPPTHARIPSSKMACSDPPTLFTLFATNDLKIMRVSSGSWGLTDYQQPDFLGSSLLDWVNPTDRGVLVEDRLRLLTLPNSTMLPNSNRPLLQNSIHHHSEKALVSPAEGMGDQYPNQNVRIIRSDQQYSLFNVRLHLGGGLGGSLYHQDTYDRLYFVISCLLIPAQVQAPPPHSRAASACTIASSNGPPTPITPVKAGSPGGLPGFSSIAAFEVPPPLMTQNTRYPSGPHSPYSPCRPGSQHQQQAPPLSTPSISVPYPRTSSTPQLQILPTPTYPAQVPSTNVYPKSPSEDLQYTSYEPYECSPPQPQNDQAYYPDYRDNQWNRHPGDGNPPPLQQLPPHTISSSSSSSNPPPPTDYSCRPWV